MLTENTTKLVNRLSDFEGIDFLKKHLYNFELDLKGKGLADITIEMKIKDFMKYIEYSLTHNREGKTIREDILNYLENGYFTTEDKIGSFSYKMNIFNNIKEFYNFIREDSKMEDLNDVEIAELDKTCMNNWYNPYVTKTNTNMNKSIQHHLLEKLGVKLYFDEDNEDNEDNEPFVLSHELAELIQKNHKNVIRDIKIKGEIELESRDKDCNFTIIETAYVDSRGKTQPSFKIYKDILNKYLLGLTPRKTDKNYFDINRFQNNYIIAFNYVERKYKESLEEIAIITEKRRIEYNETRKENIRLYLTLKNLNK